MNNEPLIRRRPLLTAAIWLGLAVVAWVLLAACGRLAWLLVQTIGTAPTP